MGRVYLAEDTRLHRRVAVKVLPPEMAADPERLERFTREAMAVASLNHPNLVTLYGVEETDDGPLLAMELVEGRTLDAVVPPGGLDRATFFSLAIPLADALAAAHEKGVTHRDLKPSNVMITDDGRVKIVDFGLAKLRQEATSSEETTLMGRGGTPLTEVGRVMGTYPYMAPEQVKGLGADERSDLFSLGVLLYEMATGRRPFAGETSADLISAILRDPPPPLGQVWDGRDVAAGEWMYLERLLARLMEKDPDQRYQSARELRGELEALDRDLTSQELLASHRRQEGDRKKEEAPPASADAEGPRRRRWWPAAAAAVGLLVVLGGLWLGGLLPGTADGDEPRTGGESGAGGALPEDSLAVLHFRNLNSDPELSWLVTGLTEMMVTNLSQSNEIQVLSTERVYEILDDLGALGAERITGDRVREVARRGKVGRVLLGNFVRVGERVRISISVQEADTGRILLSDQTEGQGQESIFGLVDDLSRSVRRRLEGPAASSSPGLDRDLAEVTTSSIEAFRYYSEGMRLRWQLKLEEAIPLFLEAVEIDPGFALAHARLVAIYEIRGNSAQAREHARQAFENRDRLPRAERYYIEGEYYGVRREDYPKAFESYEQAIAIDPTHVWARYGMGHLYSYLELFDEAIESYSHLLTQRQVYPATYLSLSSVYSAKGDFARGGDLVAELVRREPELWLSHLIYGWHHIQWGKPEEALAAYDRAAELRPGSPFVGLGRFRAYVLLGDLDAARREADELLAVDAPYWQWQGSVDRAVLSLLEGRSEEALRHLADAAAAYPESDPLVATAHCWRADLLLDLGRPGEALPEAEAARREAPGEWPAWEGMFWSALASARLGRDAEARRLAEEVEALGPRLPGQVEERTSELLKGLLALEAGESARAEGHLQAAVSMLPEEGIPWQRHRRPDQMLVWDARARAARAAGDPAAARRWYERIAGATFERLDYPVLFVRSFYHLGEIYDAAGDTEQAEEAYRRFVTLWGDGDMDREAVAAARRRLGGG